MEPKTDKSTGMQYYDSKPENCRVAKKEDFFTGGVMNLGMPYLIHSYRDGKYQVYRVNKNFVWDVNVGPWIKDGRVFVAIK